jgi:hypothetical protein
VCPPRGGANAPPRRAGENLFPPAAAVIVAAALHTLLPDALQLLVTLVIVARAVGAIQ